MQLFKTKNENRPTPLHPLASNADVQRVCQGVGTPLKLHPNYTLSNFIGQKSAFGGKCFSHRNKVFHILQHRVSADETPCFNGRNTVFPFLKLLGTRLFTGS